MHTDRPTYRQADRRSHDHSHRSHDYHHLFFMRLQMDQTSSVDPAPEPSARATRGPGGPASRWANFVLGVLGYRTRQRRPKLRSFERALVGEIGSLQWVSARLLSRAAPSSCDVPLPNLD